MTTSTATFVLVWLCQAGMGHPRPFIKRQTHGLTAPDRHANFFTLWGPNTHGSSGVLGADTFEDQEAKDGIIFVTKEDHETQSNVQLMADDPKHPQEEHGLILLNGDINRNCLRRRPEAGVGSC
ncbi:hypothetical protein E5288_WYG014180 [Bos mutus]|uniref:Uncharacterized protein n=1 Tax=Bos mutus TaxID=72004 RepID=A0A6B0R9X1_9CETA|nr:hypothetical protein [Bos mutus]